MREVIKTGRTVEDATELALAELGVSAEEAVSYTHLVLKVWKNSSCVDSFPIINLSLIHISRCKAPDISLCHHPDSTVWQARKTIFR